MTTLKQRAGKLGKEALEGSLKLRVQDIGGVRPSAEYDPRALLVKGAASTNTAGEVVAWPATLYACKCQELYSELFGTRRLACRSMTVKSAEEQAVEAGPAKRRVCISEETGKSVKAAKKQHAAAIEAVVAAQASKHAGIARSDSQDAGFVVGASNVFGCVVQLRRFILIFRRAALRIDCCCRRCRHGCLGRKC